MVEKCINSENLGSDKVWMKKINLRPVVHCSKVSGKIKALEGVENCKCTKFPDQKERYLIQIIAEKSKLHDF